MRRSGGTIPTHHSTHESLENYHSLAFFYGYEAPWNIYHKDPRVLSRLELTLNYTFALIDELKTGRIYASLDVYEKEPLPEDSPLRGLLHCQLMCHSAGPTPDSMVMFGEAAIDNIERYVNGEPVERVVDARLYDLIT